VSREEVREAEDEAKSTQACFWAAGLEYLIKKSFQHFGKTNKIDTIIVKR
jgi:hypothetical protein